MLDFLILMEDYRRSYSSLILRSPDMHHLPYEKMSEWLFSQFIYYGDSYKHALASEGFSAEQIVPDCEFLQAKWAVENGMRLPSSWLYRKPFSWAARVFPPLRQENIKFSVVTQQIRKMRPKIVWVFSGSMQPSPEIIAEWRRYSDKIILWWACPLVAGFPYNSFDMIFSGIPRLVDYFKSAGARAIHMSHSFDPRVLKYFLAGSERAKKVVFLGSLSKWHKERAELLEYLCEHVDIDFYGDSLYKIPGNNPHAKFCPDAWGRDLYSIYDSYLITIHKNIDIAKNEISAKRLFEATGMGICVVAEVSEEISEFFQPGREIVTYSTKEECLEKIRHLLMNSQEAVKIGKAAQERTLRSHTYAHNVKKMVSHLRESKLI